jgi:alpha-tubulin suppressor-like RCC1 family protein
LASGQAHTCGLVAGGATYYWGYGDVASAGALTPSLVAGGLTFTRLVAGGSHTCGLTSSGKAYCRGNNNGGELGIGAASEPQLEPVAVAGGLTFASLATAASVGCGLLADGAAYCWGGNASG